MFAHVPLILGEDKKRLSKRHGATSVTAYRDMGYYPEALNNYLVRLGWSHGDQEIFDGAELVEKFDIDAVGASSAVFNPEKLLWLNAHYLKNRPASQLAEDAVPLPLGQGLCRARRPRVAGEDGRDPEGTGQVPGGAGRHGALLPH